MGPERMLHKSDPNEETKAQFDKGTKAPTQFADKELHDGLLHSPSHRSILNVNNNTFTIAIKVHT